MKDEVIAKIKEVRWELDNTIYPLRDEYDPLCQFNYYWDILIFINWIKGNYPGVVGEDDGLFNLDETFQVFDEFGNTYIKVFPSKIPFTLYDDGILNIDIPIDKMIDKFYDLVISMSDSEMASMADKLAQQVKKEETRQLNEESAPSLQKMWEMFQGMNNKVSDVHGALFKKEKTKKDKNEVIEGGITLRLLKK